ncbi:MAG: hypothetical protein KBD00_04740 [Candidatus Peribacteraceae bacterium]|nr:hypothetical protein [Candidatus Peribacteraceae bacterium]
MSEHSHLHDQERLLASIGPSKSALVADIVSGLFDGFIIGVVIAAGINILLFTQSISLNIFSIVIPLILPMIFNAFWKHKLWKKARFRITTERILMQDAGRFKMKSLLTIKWPQYQESWNKRLSWIDYVTGAKSIGIRYGNADSQLRAVFPSAVWATDIKHYLDKVDAAFRHNQMETIKPFVEKAYGKRD